MDFKKIVLYVAMLFIGACDIGSRYPPVENALDAGRQFIDAVFKGNFKRAGMLILDDPENRRLLKEKIEDDFSRRSSADRSSLGLSSITVLSTEEVAKDSIMIISFINSYDNKPAVLKVIRKNEKWVIDLKYTFSGNL